MSAEEEHVKWVLDYAGLAIAARNHAVLGADGSVEGEVDLVYTHESYVFAIEVSGFPHRGMRHRSGMALKEWDTGALLERLSSGLGLSAADSLRTVYVSLPWSAGSEGPRDAYGGKRMGEGHVNELGEGPPERARSVFLEWNGVPHDTKTGRVLPQGKGAGWARGGEAHARAGAGGAPAAHGAVRAAALESNARLCYLIGDVYARHRAILGREGDETARGQAPRAPTPWERRLLSARYLVLELWGFEDVRRAHYEVAMGGLEAGERDGLRMIMDDHEGTRRTLEEMRGGRDAYMEHDFAGFEGKIAQTGLAHIVRYARAAHMLQDAVCRAVPRGGGQGAPAQEWAAEPPRLPTDADRKALEWRHASLLPVEGMDVLDCIWTRDLQMSLRTIYAMFRGAASQEAGEDPCGHGRPMDCAHMAKYAVLDIHGFIEKFCRLDIKSVTPDILSRKDIYARLHDDYATHSRSNKLAGTGEMLGGDHDLFGRILLDMVEVDVLASKMLDGFNIEREVVPMTEEDIAWIGRSMEGAWTWGGRRHDHEYAGPNWEAGRAV